jgi:hypothetical protein
MRISGMEKVPRLPNQSAVTNTIFVNLLKQSEEIILLFQTTNDITTYLNETLIPYGLEQLKHGGRTAIFKR